MASAKLDIDQIAPEEYPTGLYDYAAKVAALDGLPDDRAPIESQYREVGFVSIDNAFSRDQVAELLDALYQLTIRDLPERTQLQFENLAAGKIESLPPGERLDYVRKLMWFVDLDPRIEAIAYEPRLMELLTQLLGAEPEMFQEMALFKPPGIGREKPWHQDHAYFNLPEGTNVVGVWIALDDTYPENGCMHLLPGAHKDGPIPHFNRRDWQICDTDILSKGQAVATPLKAGGCLIFDGLVPHGTPHNRTNTRRRALQFHYVAKGTPRITTEERMAMFGPEGRDVSC
ncbi:MAG: phytanoyl-CoA dioxygenase family protein [Chlorobia bacterium]|nr:phytanoyl-CoA dioxygenase family protein [Fimbriimonadaceae bacterium]